MNHNLIYPHVLTARIKSHKYFNVKYMCSYITGTLLCLKKHTTLKVFGELLILTISIANFNPKVFLFVYMFITFFY